MVGEPIYIHADRWRELSMTTEKFLQEIRDEIDSIRESINTNPGAIGNMNGKWAVSFKALISAGTLALTSLVGLNVWTVTEINGLKIENAKLVTRFENFVSVGPRYSLDMAATDQHRLKEEILKVVDEKIRAGGSDYSAAAPAEKWFCRKSVVPRIRGGVKCLFLNSW